MENEFLYMSAVVAVGWAVTYAMRALPFVLFAGRGEKSLPPAVERFGDLISPVIIACLVVYSYSGLQWRTAWPYLAGALTVGLHVWKGNPLASIIAGTALYMCLVSCGCQTAPEPLVYDRAHPLIRFSKLGLQFRGEFVSAKKAVELLEKHRVPKDSVIYILVDPDYDYVNDRTMWVFQHNCLGKAGYRRTMLVHERRAETINAQEQAKWPDGGVRGSPTEVLGTSQQGAGRRTTGKPKFRYKRADEDE